MFLKRTIKYSIMLLFTIAITNNILAQNHTTLIKSGVVTDASTGMPIEGASVNVAGFSSAITDKNGAFTIDIPNDQCMLQVSEANYQYKEVAVKGQSLISVKLWEKGFNTIYKMAVLPLGEKAQNRTSNAVSTVNFNWFSSTQTMDQAIQGKVAGLNVIKRSGTQGIGSNMFIRGYNSVLASSQPLIVIDGVILDKNYNTSLIDGYVSDPLSGLDVNNIESITVVKDAASIYGSQAANGVIIVETTRAKENKTNIDFHTYGGLNFTPKQIPLLDANQYRVFATDQLSGKGLTGDEIASQPIMNDNVSYPDYYRYHNNTNWQDKVFNQSFDQSYLLRITGGDPVAKYALSVGYNSQDGIVRETASSKYFTQFNADVKPFENLLINSSFGFSYRNSDLYNDGNNQQSAPVNLALLKAPIFAPYILSSQGIATPNVEPVDMFGISNPQAIFGNTPLNNRDYRLLTSTRFLYKINKNLSISTLIGANYNKIRENVFIPMLGVASEVLALDVADNQIYHGTSSLFTVYNDSRLAFSKTIEKIHEIGFTLGTRYKTSQFESDYGKNYNSTNDKFQSLGDGENNNLRVTGGNLGNWKSMSLYAGADYQLLNKYILSLNVSADGSSRFGDKADGISLFSHKFGVFPAISAAWIVSSEGFMSDLNAVELLKLRASYGLTGNDDIGNYNNKAYYKTNRYSAFFGLIPGNLYNPTLSWETTKKLNVGLDLTLFNERLNMTADVYSNKTTNMLGYQTVDAFTGYNQYLMNGGAMENNGFEVSVSGRILKNHLKWDAGFSIANYRNKITMLADDNVMTEIANANIISRVGQPIGVFYGYKTKGVYSSDALAADDNLSTMVNGQLTAFKGGDIIFDDKTPDNIIDEKDMQVIGNPNPDFTGSFFNKFNYKRISLDVLLNFSVGNDVYNYTRYQLESMSGLENQTKAVVNRWKVDGQITDVPKATYGDPKGNSRFSDRWIEDGSYLRVKTVTLSYDIPVKEGFLRNAMVYISGNNLFTFTKYLGYDPESSAYSGGIGQGIDLGLTPQFRSIYVGVKFGL